MYTMYGTCTVYTVLYGTCTVYVGSQPYNPRGVYLGTCTRAPSRTQREPACSRPRCNAARYNSVHVYSRLAIGKTTAYLQGGEYTGVACLATTMVCSCGERARSRQVTVLNCTTLARIHGGVLSCACALSVCFSREQHGRLRRTCGESPRRGGPSRSRCLADGRGSSDPQGASWGESGRRRGWNRGWNRG